MKGISLTISSACKVSVTASEPCISPDANVITKSFEAPSNPKFINLAADTVRVLLATYPVPILTTVADVIAPEPFPKIEIVVS